MSSSVSPNDCNLLEIEREACLQCTRCLGQIQRPSIGRNKWPITLGKQIRKVQRRLKSRREDIAQLDLLAHIAAQESLVAEGRVRIDRRHHVRWLPAIRCANP